MSWTFSVWLGGINVMYLTPEGIEAKKQYVTDFLTCIKTKDAGLFAILTIPFCKPQKICSALAIWQ